MLSKENKELVRRTYASDVWHGDARMTDYCTNKTAEIALFPNGKFVPVEKEKIETRFCFGYSDSWSGTEDFDRANKLAQNARTNAGYFKSENMKGFERVLKILRDNMDHDWPDMFAVLTVPYFGQASDSRLLGLSFIKTWELIEALGGSARAEELAGKEFEWRGCRMRVPTSEELRVLYDAYEAAAREHEKKVDRYLKRYGLSKVHAWSYWQDE